MGCTGMGVVWPRCLLASGGSMRNDQPFLLCRAPLEGTYASGVRRIGLTCVCATRLPPPPRVFGMQRTRHYGGSTRRS